MGSTRVLVIGNGGREHALVWKLASERTVSDIVCAPGNAGISRLARCIPVDPADAHAVAAIARREEIDFTIIGPELPPSRGVADVFAAEGRRRGQCLSLRHREAWVGYRYGGRTGASKK